MKKRTAITLAGLLALYGLCWWIVDEDAMHEAGERLREAGLLGARTPRCPVCGGSLLVDGAYVRHENCIGGT